MLGPVMVNQGKVVSGCRDEAGASVDGHPDTPGARRSDHYAR
jgi:hypothetical protein